MEKNLLNQPLTTVRSVTFSEAKLLSEHLRINTLGDMLSFYPYRYQDRSQTYTIAALKSVTHPVQLKGIIRQIKTKPAGKKKMLVATLTDTTGSVQLVWFNSIEWVRRSVKESKTYYVFGLPRRNASTITISHPELTDAALSSQIPKGILPLYSTTQQLIRSGIDSQRIANLQKIILQQVLPGIEETLPLHFRENYGLLPCKEAINYIHFAPTKALLARARYRLKLEELLYLQLYLLRRKADRMAQSKGEIFSDTSLLKTYYEKHLPFALTHDQKKAIKEICRDMRSGHQMNRLLQGDVGSGKTIVAFLSMLLAIAKSAQVAIVAPTEVLATQHYNKLKKAAEALNITAALLTGSTPKKVRQKLLEELSNGTLSLLIGTHALMEDSVQFNTLGMAVIDEQHRFGVAQRAKLWEKNRGPLRPHILVMTATPIPRTLAMALYGDLDVSFIQEKPAGRKPIITTHHYDANRLQVFARIREEIAKGHQVYIVYPRINTSDEETQYKDLMDGYESVCRAFPKVPVSILHGKMLPTDKAYEMARFAKGETKIMVGTTILEVGINVPNATMIVIENAESFGLAQLHQLRGRVGRDQVQSYCLLLTKNKLSPHAWKRIKTMIQTEDGFELAQIDLQLRGPGDVLGVQQSGLYKLKLADLAQDHDLLRKAHTIAQALLTEDPHLSQPVHNPLKRKIEEFSKETKWGLIS